MTLNVTSMRGLQLYNGDHLELVYRSDFLTTPFPKHDSKYAYFPVMSLHRVYATPLNGVWETVGPRIVDLFLTRNIDWLSHFFTHTMLGEDEKGSFSPVVLWLGAIPGSTSSDTAHPSTSLGAWSQRCCCRMA